MTIHRATLIKLAGVWCAVSAVDSPVDMLLTGPREMTPEEESRVIDYLCSVHPTEPTDAVVLSRN